jgi:hypothetical protein
MPRGRALIRLCLSALLFFFLSSAILATEKTETPSSLLLRSVAWKEWLNRFGSSSPLLTLRKTRPLPFQITDAHLNSLLGGSQKVSFSPPLMSSEGPVMEVDLLEFETTRRFELHLQGRRAGAEEKSTEVDRQKLARRFRVIRDQMEKLIGERKEKELQIFFVGETHALDLYFSQFLKPDLAKTDPSYRVREEVAYLAPTVTGDTAFYTPDFYRFIQMFRGMALPVERFENQSKIYVTNFLARLAFNHRLRTGMVKLPQLLSEDVSQVGALVVMDWHYLDGANLFEAMPSALSLKATGVERVRLFVESLRADKTYALEDFIKTYRVSLESFLPAEDHEYYQTYRAELFEFLKKGFTTNATLEALHQKLQEFEREGIAVEIRGLEEVELW